jgi:predicted porin
MNKKLLTAAIAAGLMVPGLAAADVKIFGTIQAETGNIDVNDAGFVNGADGDDTLMGGGNSGAIWGGGSNAVGFKGTEKLGNGLSVYFKINTFFDTFDSSASFGARDTFVGIKGDGWHVQFGEMNSRYKASSVKYDPFLATGIQARAVGAVSGGHNGYAQDMMEVGFKSGGFSGGVQLTWEDSTNDTGIVPTGGLSDVVDAGSWNANVKYAANGWEAGFAYQDLDYGSGAGDADQWKIHGKWSGNGFSVMAQYEDVDASTAAAAASPRPDGGSTIFGIIPTAGGAADDYDALMISATYAFSDSTTLAGRYSNTDWDDLGGAAGADVDGDHWAIGVIHNLSKRTHVYGGYMDNEYDMSGSSADVEVDAWGLGMRHKF